MAAYYIDALTGSAKWSQDANGITTTVTYTYNSLLGNLGNGLATSLRLFTPAEQKAAETAFAEYAKVANLVFVNTGSLKADTDIVLRAANIVLKAGDTPGWGFDPNETTGTDVILDSGTLGSYSLAPGNYGFRMFMHELGHTMGLEHPFEGTTVLQGAENSINATIMSYTDGTLATRGAPYSPQGLQIYDIAALQYLYGVNHNYNAGNNTYALTGDARTITFWDGNGLDTFDSSAYTGNVTLDLREGLNNVSKVGYSSSWIAFGANIENATGGAGNDMLTGNQLANSLSGGAGIDMLFGGGGNDSLRGGTGADMFVLQNNGGSDIIADYSRTDGDLISFADITSTGVTIKVSGSNSIITTTQGNNVTVVGVANLALSELEFSNGGISSRAGSSGAGNVLTGTDKAETLSGTDAVDSIAGNGSNDSIHGAGGYDYLDGGTGNDSLNGNKGNDALFGGAGTNLLFGGDGNDSVNSSGALDTVSGDLGNDYIQSTGNSASLQGATGDDTVSGAGANATISGDAGNDYLQVSGASALLRGGDGNDSVNATSRNDTIFGDAGADNIVSTGANLLVYGGAGDDYVSASASSGGDRMVFAGNSGSFTISAYNGGFVLNDKTGVEGKDLVYGVDEMLFNDGMMRASGTTLTKFAMVAGRDNGNNNLSSGKNSDYLDGMAGNDTLNAGAGRDYLAGGTGNDMLTGGADADIFMFGAGNGLDTITDFVSGSDKLLLAGLFTDSALAHVRYTGGNAVLTVDSGNSVTLLGVQALSAGDFIV